MCPEDPGTTALAPGTRLGPYEITAKLGEGGMGVVYRARDTRLGRDVALKLLPEAFAEDPERHARFEREGKLLASLNHPHIATLYGLEHLEGQHVLVLELVEGEGLDERIARGALSIDEALPIALQIAEGLEAAHERGIVHRDLKPANVKVRPDGTAKVLDFGLAKAWEEETTGSDPAHSPTVTGVHTKAGMILGTVAYMSPEQARGKAVDKRADIWAFGCLLYQMLTGAAVFRGDTVTDVMAAILTEEPDLGALPQALPETVGMMLRRCLEKDSKRRLRDIGEARVVLERIAPVATAAALAVSPAASDAFGIARLPSVAVLPFLNISADPENEFFADGITEDVIAHLAKIKSIKVISRTSVMTFKNADRNLREIAAKLGAATLLEGSVRRAGSRVRIVAQLVDGATDEHLWADTYDRDLTDIFAIQTDVALNIAGALRAELTNDERERVNRRPTDNLEAYEHFLQGRAWMNLFSPEGFRRSLIELDRAIKLDPGFALAYTLIAQIQTEHGISGIVGRSPEEAVRLAKEAVSRALELDEELAEAHGTTALIRFAFDFDWHGAEREFLKAIELGPGVAETHEHYGWMLTSMGRYDEALREVMRARELDPILIQSDVGTTLLRAGRVEEALAEARQVIVSEPGSARCHSNLGWALIFSGDGEAGIASLEHAVAISPGATLFLAQLGQARAMVGDEAGARAILAQLRQLARDQFVSPYHFAYVHAGLGEKDEAIDWLEQAFERRSGAIYGIKGSFLFRDLHDHPRFQALLRKMNL
jgi:serine/threonine protein kinase/tetratricopeptide (TPR) repeat protein